MWKSDILTSENKILGLILDLGLNNMQEKTNFFSYNTDSLSKSNILWDLRLD